MQAPQHRALFERAPAHEARLEAALLREHCRHAVVGVRALSASPTASGSRRRLSLNQDGRDERDDAHENAKGARQHEGEVGEKAVAANTSGHLVAGKINEPPRNGPGEAANAVGDAENAEAERRVAVVADLGNRHLGDANVGIEQTPRETSEKRDPKRLREAEPRDGDRCADQTKDQQRLATPPIAETIHRNGRHKLTSTERRSQPTGSVAELRG
jgi:hypothetical protein